MEMASKTLRITAILAVLLLIPLVSAVSVTLVSPGDGDTILKGDTIDLDIAGGEIFGVNYSIDFGTTNISLSDPWDIVANWTKGATTLTTYTGNSTGLYELTYNFEVNNSLPVVTAVTPATNSFYASTINLTAIVSDLDGLDDDVNDVEFFYSLANQTIWTSIDVIDTHTDGVFLLEWDTTELDDETYKIKAVAADEDEDGENTSIGNLTINNNNQNPVVDLTSLTGGQTVEDEVAITWTATDPDGETDLDVDIYYTVDNSSWVVITTDDANDGTHTWNTDDVGNGANYRILLNVTDQFGGFASDVSGSTFTVENTAGGGSSSDSSDTGEVSGGNGGLSDSTAGVFDISRIFQSIEAGQNTEINIAVSELAVKKLSFIVSGTEIDARVKVRDLEALPSSISVEPSGVYQFFEVDTTNLASLTSATFEFEIPASWLTSNSVAKEDVVVKRYSFGWSNIPTAYVGESGGNYKYTATTPGFSVFAITGVTSAVEEVAIAESSVEDAVADETTDTPFNLFSGFAGASLPSFNFPELNLPDIPYLPGGWASLSAILAIAIVGAVLIAGRQGLISLPSHEFKLPDVKMPKVRSRSSGLRVRKVPKLNLPEFHLPQFELPSMPKKQKKLRFGKKGWKKHKKK